MRPLGIMSYLEGLLGEGCESDTLKAYGEKKIVEHIHLFLKTKNHLKHGNR